MLGGTSAAPESSRKCHSLRLDKLLQSNAAPCQRAAGSLLYLLDGPDGATPTLAACDSFPLWMKPHHNDISLFSDLSHDDLCMTPVSISCTPAETPNIDGLRSWRVSVDACRNPPMEEQQEKPQVVHVISGRRRRDWWLRKKVSPSHRCTNF